MGMGRDTKVFMALALGIPGALYLLLIIYPALRGFYASLFRWDGFSPEMTFVGMRNFRELLQDEFFWNVVMLQTFGIVFVGGAVMFAIALLFSHYLTQDIKAKKFLRATIFFPNIVNPVALAVLWSFIYNREWGLINEILRNVGLPGWVQTWTAPDRLFWALLVALVWIYVGFFTVILVAALDRIPKDFVDAALIDGASQLRIFFSIKLPMIRGVLNTVAVLWIVQGMKQFGFLYAYGGGGNPPLDGQQNLAVHMFITSFGQRTAIFRMGYASAMGVLLIILVAGLALLFRRFRGRERLEY